MKINSKTCVKFILFFSIIMETLIIFNFPAIIRYINDIANLFLLIFLVKNYNKILENRRLKKVLIIVFIYFFISTISALINFVPLKLYLWAFRNTFRGIIYFFAVAIFLDEHDVKRMFNVLFVLQIINCLLAMYQFFILHHAMDYVGGIFRIWKWSWS